MKITKKQSTEFTTLVNRYIESLDNLYSTSVITDYATQYYLKTKTNKLTIFLVDDNRECYRVFCRFLNTPYPERDEVGNTGKCNFWSSTQTNTLPEDHFNSFKRHLDTLLEL